MTRFAKVALVAALGKNREIGKGGALPWHLPEDLKFFRDLTRGHPVVMGRKTYESIGRLLPGRPNWIVSRTPAALRLPEGGYAAGTLSEALAGAREKSDEDGPVFVIGGGQIYQEALPFADLLFLTRVDVDVAGADAFFPAWVAEHAGDAQPWRLAHSRVGQSLPAHTYETWERADKPLSPGRG